MTNDDYITPEQRLNPERPSSGDVLLEIRARLARRMDAAREDMRARGRLLIDPACAWRPTSAAQTDVAATMQAERERLAKGARKPAGERRCGMTLRAYLITLRDRIREALIPELQELRDRLAKEIAATDSMRPLFNDYISTISVRGLQQQLILSQKDTITRLEADARRGRFLLDEMQHQRCGPRSGWTLTELYPGDDPAAAVDAAMNKETKNAD